MAYWLKALIFPDANLDFLFRPLAHAHRIRLSQHLCLLPITKEFRDEIAEHYPANQTVTYKEMGLRSGSVIELAKAISRIVPVAYIEATYTGGYGGQESIVWKDSEVVLGPLTVQDSINRALRFLGVSKGEAADEFDAIGLHLHRWTREWLHRNEGV